VGTVCPYVGIIPVRDVKFLLYVNIKKTIPIRYNSPNVCKKIRFGRLYDERMNGGTIHGTKCSG
jgi:hypothetical protein